jgi:hypothetical protein
MLIILINYFISALKYIYLQKYLQQLSDMM